jgi:8-oxo-dGTP pyrophosphatase MutT (NUDIX family)
VAKATSLRPENRGLVTKMRFAGNVFDVWTFQRRPEGIVFLLLYTSVEKATRYFNGGRFWQIPSGTVDHDETMTDAIHRELGKFGVRAKAIWAGEHAYVIYNPRFEEMQAIAVFAAEALESEVALKPSEHAEFGWFTFDDCLQRVHYRGLKDGLRSVHEYVTGVTSPAKELCLYVDRESPT